MESPEIFLLQQKNSRCPFGNRLKTYLETDAEIQKRPEVRDAASAA